MPDDTSTILSLPYILPSQAQKHVTHNEALRQLDVIVQLAVTARNLAVPPANPAQGDRYIVAAGASGDWAGKSGQIALFDAGAWQFFAPVAGWTAWVADESQLASFNGSLWVAQTEVAQSFPQIGVSASADATNRLTVSSPATLFNHAGAGHQVKVNKSAATDTASLLFQTGFSGRAEMGTAGNDDFSIKVSADGSAFVTGLSIAAETGQVTLPAAMRLGGQLADPVSPVDGMIWLNSTTGTVKVRSNGATIVIAALNGITNAQMANMAAATFKGRDAGSLGAPQDLTPAQAAALLPVVTSTARGLAPASGGGSANFLRADGAWAAPTVNGVTNTQLATMAAATFKGRDTGTLGAPQDLTPAQAAAILPVVTSTARGLAPPSGGGSTNFLRADGTWAAPAVSGGLPSLGITANAAQINPLAAPFDNAFLGAGATGSLALGANDFSNPARWVDTVTNGGVTATKSATGVDANGVPWVEYTLNGTVVTLVTLQLFSSATPFQSAAAGQTFTCGGVASLMSGTATGGLVGARFALYFRNATAGQSEATSSTPVATNTAAITQVVYTAANAATVNVQAAAEIRMPLGAVFTNAVFRFSALQLDRGPSRLTYAFRALSAAEARTALGLPLDANGILPLSALGFTGSLGTTGWRRTPDGLIEQWGTVTTGASGVTVTFPIAFPNAIHTLHMAVNGGAALLPTFQSQSQSAAFIQVWNTSGVQQSGIGVHWRALGR